MDAGRLIEANIRAHTVDGYTAFHMVAAAHETTIRALVSQLNEATGANAQAQPGSHITTMVFGVAEVQVEYEYEAAEQPIYDADHPGVGPGRDASVSILNVLINGVWCDPEDVVPDVVLACWTERIFEQCTEAA